MMLIFFGVLFVLAFISEAIIPELPEFFSGLFALIGFLFRCLWIVLMLAVEGCVWTLEHAARLAVNAGLFIAILFDEWRRGRRQEAGEQAFADEGDADEQDDEQEQEQARQDDYAAALALLGLSEPFTQADLKRLYRKAMKTAHPDAGGAKETAQALNTARDLIAALKGWK